MIKKYIEYIQTRPTHERRAVAMQISGVITAILMVAWVSSIGVRLAQHSSDIAQGASQVSSAAATLIAVPQASSTQY